MFHFPGDSNMSYIAIFAGHTGATDRACHIQDTRNVSKKCNGSLSERFPTGKEPVGE